MKYCLLIISFVCVGFDILAQEDPITTINLLSSTSYQHKLKLSDIASDIEYVSLETSKQSIMSGSFECKLVGNYIFVMQRDGVLQFRRDGKFIRQVNKVGQGPGECFTRCYAIDEQNQLIYMYNNYTHQIMVYGFDGKFKRRMKIISNQLQMADK